MSIAYNPKIVTNGLVAAIDASNPRSYPGTGTTVYDISGNGNHSTINGTVSFVSNGSASYFDWATQGNSNYIYSNTSFAYVDITIVFLPDFTLSVSDLSTLVGIVSSGAPNSDKSLRFVGANGTGPWNVTGRNPGDTNDWAYPTATSYYVNGTVTNTIVSGWNVFGGYRTNQSSYPLTSAYYLGSSGYSQRGFRGRIAACYLYNRQLTATEQKENFNALRGRFGL